MNKTEFINILDSNLTDISQEDKKDILYDYEEHFRIGLENGKTEEAIAEALGNPIEISKQFRTDRLIDKDDVEVSAKNKFFSKKILFYLIGIGALLFFGISIIFFTGSGTFLLNENKHFQTKNYSVTKQPSSTNSVVTSGSNSANYSNSSSDSKSEQVINDNKNGDISGANTILITTSSINPNIIAEDRKDVGVELTGKIISTQKVEYTLTVEKKGATLEIKVNFNNTMQNNFASDLKFIIRIPKTYNENMAIDVQSGNVNINDLTLKSMVANLSSGNTDFNNCTVDKLNCTNSSGNIKGENITTKNTQIKSSSGNIDISDFSGNMHLDSESGNTNIGYSNFNNDIDVKSTSGMITIKLPKNAQFYLDAKTSSGIVSCKFPITIDGTKKSNELKGTVKDNKNKITVNITSGIIRIR